VREHPEGERATVKWLSGGSLYFPCEGWFFFPMPPLDAHGDQAEQARPWWRRTLPAMPMSFIFPFSLSLFLLGLGFLGTVGISE
jgi:hypothetical protein